jgi:protein-disulfide isomerase
MKRRGPPVRWLTLFAGLLLMATLVACANTPEGLGRQVDAQNDRIAALETSVARLQPTPTVPPPPTPTAVPAVANLVVDGNTKGSPDAPVTLTEFTDYL